MFNRFDQQEISFDRFFMIGVDDLAVISVVGKLIKIA